MKELNRIKLYILIILVLISLIFYNLSIIKPKTFFYFIIEQYEIPMYNNDISINKNVKKEYDI